MIKQTRTQRQAWHQVATVNGEEARLDFERRIASTEHQRRARKARDWKARWIETGCDRQMILSDFKQIGRRNKIRREYGFEPIFLAGEEGPKGKAAGS